uniref:Fibrinogen C-terminal domain-containing protein n=1 Tax=Biomphalaria glabrata TaxID=6526 RepID=A0A2C9KAB3_BIOGL
MSCESRMGVPGLFFNPNPPRLLPWKSTYLHSKNVNKPTNLYDADKKLVIEVQPNVISAEITAQLVINCSITNNQVQHLDVIRSLTLSRYNETRKEFFDLLTLESKTLNLSQLVQLHHAQISFGNLYISLTLHNPTQFDAKVYRCKVEGDKTNAANSSIVAKKEVEYRTNTTALIEEIRRLKVVEKNDQCSLKNEKLTSHHQKTKLNFVGSSKVIKEMIEPLTLTCSLQNLDHNSTVQFMYILHEPNGVIATINKDQPVVTTKQESNLNMAKGKLSDTKLQASFIEVSWSYINSSESGKYFCGAHVMEPDGRYERLNEVLAIIVLNPTFDDLVKVIPKLLRQADIEKENVLDNKNNIYHIKEDINTKQQNIKSIKDGLDTNSQNIKSIKDGLDTNSQNIISIKDGLDTNSQNIKRIKDGLDTNSQNINIIKDDLETSRRNIKSITDDLNANKQSIASHNDELNSLRQIVNSLKDDLRTNKQSLQSIRDEVNTNKENINQLKEDLKSNKQNTQNITEDVNTNRLNIMNINKDLNTSQQSLSKLEADLETQLANLSNTLTSIKEQVEKDLKTSQQSLSKLQFNLETQLINNSNVLMKIKEKVEKVSSISCRDTNSTHNRIIVKLLSGLKVMCDTKTDGGGWIIFHRRINGKVYFYRGWQEYRDSFGDYNIGEFYLGNENIFKLTSTGQYDLRIDLEFNNTKYFAQYENFKVLSETEKYKLQIGKYSGNATEDLSRHNNMFFTTFDSDNDIHSSGNCAEYSSGAWWYANCHDSNLNGQWGRTSYSKGMNWYELTGYSNSVSFSEMKIRER